MDQRIVIPNGNLAVKCVLGSCLVDERRESGCQEEGRLGSENKKKKNRRRKWLPNVFLLTIRPPISSASTHPPGDSIPSSPSSSILLFPERRPVSPAFPLCILSTIKASAGNSSLHFRLFQRPTLSPASGIGSKSRSSATYLFPVSLPRSHHAVPHQQEEFCVVPARHHLLGARPRLLLRPTG